MIFCNPLDCSPPGVSVHGDFPGKNTGVGCYALLQGIFPTQGLIPGLQHCRQILYHLSHQGRPRILVWVDYTSSRGLSQPRNWTGVSCITGRFFTSWDTREARTKLYFLLNQGEAKEEMPKKSTYKHWSIFKEKKYIYTVFLVFFFFKIYLFSWLCWVFVPTHRLSLVVTNWGYSLLMVHGLFIMWLLSLQSTGSIVVVHRLSCSAACGIFLDQGSNPCSLH